MTTPRLVVGALIRDGGDRIFVQQRSWERRLFPGRWDIVGGAVERDEDPMAALRREITEETGWRLRRVLAPLGPAHWTADGVPHTELDFVVEVDGDLSAPRLEPDKHLGHAWVGPGDLALLDQHRVPGESTFITDLVTAAHRWLAAAAARRS
ncbi:NUDIX hydrolase [Streptomyces sp. NPDC059853]|uniref:NUDIX hydrolase n=1 Tax=Streptomyces sp. NPDC059853 TaxID=3346973 RepID=UPI0036642267